MNAGVMTLSIKTCALPHLVALLEAKTGREDRVETGLRNSPQVFGQPDRALAAHLLVGRFALPQHWLQHLVDAIK